MSNLPDDVTHQDIDDHFGEPETRTIHGTVSVAVSIETQFFDSQAEIEKELAKAVENCNFEQVLEVHNYKSD